MGTACAVLALLGCAAALSGCGSDPSAGPQPDSLDRLQYRLQAGDVVHYEVRIVPDLFPEPVAIVGRETHVVLETSGEDRLTVVPLQSGVRLVAASGAEFDLDAYAAAEARTARDLQYFSSPFFDAARRTCLSSTACLPTCRSGTRQRPIFAATDGPWARHCRTCQGT